MWGEIISAGASLLGGLFGSKKKQTTTSEVDYSKMAANAQAAGFNPLTAIRNGGSAGFTTTTSPTISAMPEVLGNLGGILGNALDKKLDPIEAKKREIDTILLDRQLGQLKMGPQVPGGWKPRSTFEGTKVSTQLAPRVGPSATTRSASVPMPKFKSDMGYKQDDAPKVMNAYPSGIYPDPNTPNADDIETRLGDDLLSPAFWYVGGNDLGYNIDGWFRRRGLPWGPNEAGRAIRGKLQGYRERLNASSVGRSMGLKAPYRPRGGGGGGW